MRHSYLLIGIPMLFACKHLQTRVNADKDNIISPIINLTDPALSCKNGFWDYAGNLFSGTIIKHFQDHSTRQSTQYQKGKEHGWQHTFYPGGSLAEKRYYTNGEKDSVHTGWWQNGKKRFEYNFVNGIYHGDYKEWYESGQMLKHIHYTEGTDDWGKGWRDSGKPYMNYVMKKGRRYGIVNSNLCYTIKNGKGEYAKSAPAD